MTLIETKIFSVTFSRKVSGPTAGDSLAVESRSPRACGSPEALFSTAESAVTD
jgi:hypothetical protein